MDFPQSAVSVLHIVDRNTFYSSSDPFLERSNIQRRSFKGPAHPSSFTGCLMLSLNDVQVEPAEGYKITLFHAIQKSHRKFRSTFAIKMLSQMTHSITQSLPQKIFLNCARTVFIFPVEDTSSLFSNNENQITDHDCPIFLFFRNSQH